MNNENKVFFYDPEKLYYLLGIPFAFVFVGSLYIFNTFYNDDLGWVKYVLKIGVLWLILSLISMYIYEFFGGGVENFFMTGGDNYDTLWTIYFIYNPVAVYAIRLQIKIKRREKDKEK